MQRPVSTRIDILRQKQAIERLATDYLDFQDPCSKRIAQRAHVSSRTVTRYLYLLDYLIQEKSVTKIPLLTELTRELYVDPTKKDFRKELKEAWLLKRKNNNPQIAKQ